MGGLARRLSPCQPRAVSYWQAAAYTVLRQKPGTNFAVDTHTLGNMKHSKRFFRGMLLMLGMCMLGHAFSAAAAVANVSVVNNAFVPATTNIQANDTVIWTWPLNSFSHNVVSDSTPQAWLDSPVLNGPATFTNTFTAPGTFPYECTVHGFTGSIVVSAAPLPPRPITLTSPAVAGGMFQFVVTGLAIGKTNYVQASSHLSSSSSWASIATNVATSTNLRVTGISVTNSTHLFFRVIQKP